MAIVPSETHTQYVLNLTLYNVLYCIQILQYKIKHNKKI